MLQVMLMFFLAAGSATPRAAVERFATAYLKTEANGVLEGKARKQLAPMLSRRLLARLDEVRACQQDWIRQQPKDTTDKPPFVDCCVFSSTPDGMPASFKVSDAQALPDGRFKVVVHYAMKASPQETIRWDDTYVVKKEGGRFVIDDLLYEDGAAMSASFTNCRGAKWVDGP